jgi:hypothetical protein
MKFNWFHLLGLFICLGCSTLGMSQTNGSSGEAPKSLFDGFTKEEKIQFWANRDSVLRLRLRYENAMKFKQSGSVGTLEVTNQFLALFESYAKVWNDLIPEPLPITPTDYAAIVRNFLSQGIETEVKIKEESMNNLDDPKFFRYYKVGEGKNEYFMHLVVEKKIWTQLNEQNQPIRLKEPRIINLEMVFHVDPTRKTTKIAEIKPMAH